MNKKKTIIIWTTYRWFFVDVRGVMHSVNSRVEHGLTIGPPSFCSGGFRYRRSVKRIFVHSMTSKMCYKVFYSIMLVRLLILTNEKRLVVFNLLNWLFYGTLFIYLWCRRIYTEKEEVVIWLKWSSYMNCFYCLIFWSNTR